MPTGAVLRQQGTPDASALSGCSVLTRGEGFRSMQAGQTSFGRCLRLWRHEKLGESSKMTREQQLQHASDVMRCLDETYGVDEATRKERVIRAVHGNLSIERPDLKVEHVRKVLGANRSR